MKALRLFFVVGVMALCVTNAPADKHSQEQQFQEAIHLMETKGDYPAAIRLFQEIAKGPDRNLAARSLLYVGICYEKLGKDEAKKAYQRIIQEFADQQEVVTEARARLAILEQPIGPAVAKGMMVRKLWAGPDVDFYGAPSRDGRYLSYVDWETSDLNHNDLAIYEIGTGKKRRLTNNVSWYESGEYH